MQGSQIAHRRERCPQRSEKKGNPEDNLHFGKEAELPTVGNAVLSVPFSLPRGEGGTAQAVTDEG